MCPAGSNYIALSSESLPCLAQMANHHIIRSMLSVAMDRSSGAPSTSRQAKLAPILSGDRIVRSGAAEELRNPHVFSANGSWGSSSQAWIAGAGVDDDKSYIREQISAGNAVIMEGMVNASDVQQDNDDGGDEAISSQLLVPYVGMTLDIVDNARAYYNKYNIERQAIKFYTRAVLGKFQEQVTPSTGYIINQVHNLEYEAEACSIDPTYNLVSDVIKQLWPVVSSMKKEKMQKEEVVEQQQVPQASEVNDASGANPQSSAPLQNPARVPKQGRQFERVNRKKTLLEQQEDEHKKKLQKEANKESKKGAKKDGKKDSNVKIVRKPKPRRKITCSFCCEEEHTIKTCESFLEYKAMMDANLATKCQFCSEEGHTMQSCIHFKGAMMKVEGHAQNS
ncbi:Protein FAR1-RELATED SEQUENCE 5 [Hordeum vulgare]|nr:Protein FAR1-RELATED SEQUENCE 5 [Hordeum vulgare]